VPRPTLAATGASHDEPGVDPMRGAWLSHLITLSSTDVLRRGRFSRQPHTSRDAKEQADRTTVPQQLEGVSIKIDTALYPHA